MEICQNCQHEINLNFCPNCGQKKYKRIDASYLKDEIQYTLLHTNKGFFYTLKKIISKPGQTTKEYLDGNRINHYKPLLLVFVLTGISTFISYKLLNMGDVMTSFFEEVNKESGNQAFSQNYMAFLYNYTTLIIMSFLPFLALSSYLAFKNQGHNYFEHVIINSFFFVLYTIAIIFIISPILYFIKDPQTYLLISFGATILGYPLIIWFYKGLYPHLSIGQLLWKTTLMAIYAFILYLIVSISSGIVVSLFKLISN